MRVQYVTSNVCDVTHHAADVYGRKQHKLKYSSQRSLRIFFLLKPNKSDLARLKRRTFWRCRW